MGGKEVKKALIDRDISAADLAEMTGFSRGHLYGVINGRYKSLRAKKIIALALGKDYRELWGLERESKEVSTEHK